MVDVLIIGGGPAGTTAAAILAEKGLKVTLVEREAFPRFRIGESLLPGGNELLKQIGVWDKMDDAGFIRKYGAEFISTDGSQRVHNIFANGFVKNMDYTYQVERSKFDGLLLDNAREKGVEVLQPCKVTKAEEVGDGWRVTVDQGEGPRVIETPWLLDASGRTAFLGRRLKLPEDNIPYPKRFAVYNHFENVKRRPGKEGGNIIITRLTNGWFWSIPLDETKTSVGVVSVRNKDEWKDPDFTAQTFFDNEVERSPFLTEWMSEAKELDEYRVTADYTYSFSRYGGGNYLLLGDAASFIDPIFSSGVYIAMRSGSMAADALLKAHADGRQLSEAECVDYTRALKKNVRTMRDLIEVFYDQNSFSVFMSPSTRFQLFQSVNSIVAGNSSPSFSLWWRFKLFLLICKLNQRFNFIATPALN